MVKEEQQHIFLYILHVIVFASIQILNLESSIDVECFIGRGPFGLGVLNRGDQKFGEVKEG